MMSVVLQTCPTHSATVCSFGLLREQRINLLRAIWEVLAQKNLSVDAFRIGASLGLEFEECRLHFRTTVGYARWNHNHCFGHNENFFRERVCTLISILDFYSLKVHILKMVVLRLLFALIGFLGTTAIGNVCVFFLSEFHRPSRPSTQLMNPRT